MSVLEDTKQAHWGLSAFFFGVLALIAAVLLMSGFMMPEPEQSVGTTIGEIARDIRNAALGNPTEAAQADASSRFDVQALLSVVTPVLAGIATVLGGISMYRREHASLSKMAIAFGLSAIVMQYVFWLAVLVCGVFLLATIVSNMDGILGG